MVTMISFDIFLELKLIFSLIFSFSPLLSKISIGNELVSWGSQIIKRLNRERLFQMQVQAMAQ